MISDAKVVELLTEIAARQKETVEVVARSPKPERGKDLWDKLGTISSFLSTVVIAVASLVVTQLFSHRQGLRDGALRDQEIKVAKIEVVQGFMPYLLAEEEEKRQAAYAAIRALGDTDLVLGLAQALARPGVSSAEVAVLRDIAATGTDAQRVRASDAIDVVRARGARLDSLRGELKKGLTRETLADLLSSFSFDSTPECTLAEARRMLEFLGVPKGDIVERSPEVVSAPLGPSEEVTIWLNSYGDKKQYGLRFGAKDGSYFASNETLLHIRKPG